MKKKIILATTSPCCNQDFAMFGIPFQIEGNDLEEYEDYFQDRPNDQQGLAMFLAKWNAEMVANKTYRKDCLIIGFDSVGWFNERELCKPGSREEAFKRLMWLSGKSYQFLTGFYAIDFREGEIRESKTKLIFTSVEMNVLTENEVNQYLDLRKKHGTCVQGFDPLVAYGATLIKRMTGSYNNVLRDMPIEIIVEMIREFGFEVQSD